MRALYFIPAALLGVAGCATTPDNPQYARADCKVVAMQPGYINGTKHADVLAQRQAEMDLATSGYRVRNINRVPNNVEDALRDCY
jgi:hypothetical protein